MMYNTSSYYFQVASISTAKRLSLSSEQDARARMLLLLKKKMERKIVIGCSGPIIWIGILIKRCVGWRWRKERI